MNPATNLLDGRRFDGVVLERGNKPTGEKWVVAGEVAAAKAR